MQNISFCYGFSRRMPGAILSRASKIKTGLFCCCALLAAVSLFPVQVFRSVLFHSKTRLLPKWCESCPTMASHIYSQKASANSTLVEKKVLRSRLSSSSLAAAAAKSRNFSSHFDPEQTYPTTSDLITESNQRVRLAQLRHACDRAIFPPPEGGQHPGHSGANILLFLPQGRLGNHMFTFASTLGIAQAQNRVLCLSSWDILLRIFELNGVERVHWKKSPPHWSVLREQQWATFDKRLMTFPASNVAIRGYLQSWRYFHQIRGTLRKLFTFREPVALWAKRILAQLWDRKRYPPNSTARVGVHVRRSDYLSASSKSRGYTAPRMPYFYRALEWMREAVKGKDVVFVVVSDDTEWCVNHLNGGDVKTAPPAPPEVHLAILAQCDHVIVSSGTFGWWGAWLTGGKVVYYKNFPAVNSSLEKGFNKTDYFMPSWVGLE